MVTFLLYLLVLLVGGLLWGAQFGLDRSTFPASVIAVAVFVLFPRQLVGLYLDSSDPETPVLIGIATGLMFYAALFQLTDAMQVIGLGLLRGVQDTRVPMIIAAISYWLVGMPIAYGLAFVAGLGPAGLWLAWQAGPGLIVIGLAGLAIGWAYSAPPLALASRGLGEAAVAAGWLLVVVGSDYVQRAAFALAPLQAGLSYALLVAAILFINEFPDRRGDAAAGKRTLVVRLGPDGAKWAWLGLVLAAYGWLVLMVGRGYLPQGAAAAALTLILSFRAARSLLAHAAEPCELAPALRLTIAAAHLHGLVLAATLALGRWPGALS